MLGPFWGSWVPIQHNVVWADAYLLTKCLWPLFWGRGAGSPSNSNTMLLLLGLRPTSLQSGILIHPGISRQHIWAENLGGVLCPFEGEELGPHLTQGQRALILFKISALYKSFTYLLTSVVTTIELSPPPRWLATTEPTPPPRCSAVFTAVFLGAVSLKLPLSIPRSSVQR